MGDDCVAHPAPNIYHDRRFDLDAAKILPGEYYASKRDMLLVTVLGSCVSACLWDARAKVGGMNHFMLPQLGDRETAEVIDMPARYGVYAMEVLINQMLKLGAQKDQVRAKVFGGANVTEGFTHLNVGGRNCAFVQDYLKQEGIAIIGSDLLDVWPRKVYFFTATGRVLVKKLRSLHNRTLMERERVYDKQLRQTRLEGEVELF
ncbi:MAG: chemoreceptor glutamine deamidase CheD [Burkholderiaceae bacterium]|nr:MAG: chemoreceptor glutamine deamidase CheD [Burkholderiaceae bacterium]